MSITQVTVDTDSWFRVVYPQDFVLPGSLAHALDSAGIQHNTGSFPYATDDSDTGVAYLVEAERLAALGSRKKIVHALELIENNEHAATIIIAEPGESSLLWLAESEHVAGWLVRPLDAAAIIATVTGARKLAAPRDAPAKNSTRWPPT